MLAILNSLNAHNLPIFQPILMIFAPKFMVHRALSDKAYTSLGLLSPLSSVGKRLKKSMRQVLALRQSRCFFLISAITLKICQKHRASISHIERTVNVLGEDLTKITITNASIDKQISLKRVYVYKIENTDLEIGVSGVLLRILFYFEARRCSRQTGSVYALRINLLNKLSKRSEVVVHL